MARIGRKLRSLEDGLVAFMCPGCKEYHHVRVEGEGKPKWGYNQSPDAPTFRPSIRVRGVRLDMTDKEFDEMWKQYPTEADREKLFADKRYATCCHSFVVDGNIQFLPDCTHELAGQTVELPDIEED